MIRCRKEEQEGEEEEEEKEKGGRGDAKKVSGFRARPQRALMRRPWFRRRDYDIEKG